MPTTLNLLSASTALDASFPYSEVYTISGYPFDWEFDNSTLELISSDLVITDSLAIKIYPADADVITASVSVPLTQADSGRYISFNAKMKSSSQFDAAVSLFFDGDISTAQANILTIPSGFYNAIHSYPTLVPDDGEEHTVTILIELSGHRGNNLFFTLPHLIHDLAFYKNPFVGSLRNYLPDFYWDKDSDAESPSYPFFKLFDSLTAAAGDSARELNRMYGFESSELLTISDQIAYDVGSSLVSPRHVRDEYAAWLAQFIGEKLYRNFQLSDGSFYFNNPALRRDFIEWQLTYGHYGIGAGTRQAMIQAAQQVLIRTKDGSESTRSVAVAPRHLGDPFVIQIQTLTNETLDANEGESSSLVLQSVSLAKPLGYSLVHETVDEFFFTWDNPTLGVLDELNWA